MAKLSNEGYEAVARELHAKGIKADEIFPILEENNFSIKFKGKVYTNVYVSKLMSIMFDMEEDTFLDLDSFKPKKSRKNK